LVLFQRGTPWAIQLVSGANSALCGVRLKIGEVNLFNLRAADEDGKSTPNNVSPKF